MNKTFVIILLGFFVSWLLIKWLQIRYTLERFPRYEKKIHHPKESPFIRRILPNSVNPANKPIQVYHQGAFSMPLPSALFNIKRYNTRTILLDGEPFHVKSHYPMDMVISTKKDASARAQYSTSNFFYIPAWSLILAESSKWSVPDLLERNFYPKSKFCAYMYSNCNSKSFDGVAKREQFFSELNALRPVDALGKCSHNVASEPTRHYENWFDQAVETYKPYKFVIAFENTTEMDGYVTEKFILPLLAGCVPIYLGSASVKTQFNPQCFINASDFGSFEECIRYVLRVDRDDQLYQSFLRAPIISKERLVQYAGWYYGTAAFYDKLFTVFPDFKRYPYQPVYNGQWKSNPNFPIKVINLDRSVDRWNSVQQKLQTKPFLKYERFPAVDGKLNAEALQPHIDTSWWHKNFSAGEVGIYLSVMEICTALTLDSQNEYYVIFEDDVLLSDDMQPIEEYIQKVPADWDILLLGKNKRGCKIKPAQTQYVRTDSTCMPGNFGVVFRKRAAQFFINFAFPIQQPIDELYRTYCSNLHIYALHPSVVEADYNIPTTIHDNSVQGTWFEVTRHLQNFKNPSGK